ncbi:MAG: polyhydroxyalkanoate synthesis repressor PhaR [Hyphomicrobiales bacterium]|nr:polyhydroxyalkanoate synthesis repressor PhaR [Hyphomicrobiales bacterium]
MAEKQNSEQILITRYSSRRLYNTNSSDYVTLDDIAALIREGKDIRIVDKKSGDDITRQILLQIITEHESRGENILPLNVLTDIVRSYSNQAQEMVPDFLEQSFQVLKKKQEEIFGNLDPGQSIKNLQQWQQDQYSAIDSMMSSWMGGLNAKTPENEQEQETPPDKETDRQDASKDAEVEELKQQLKEMQDKINRL